MDDVEELYKYADYTAIKRCTTEVYICNVRASYNIDKIVFHITTKHADRSESEVECLLHTHNSVKRSGKVKWVPATKKEDAEVIHFITECCEEIHGVKLYPEDVVNFLNHKDDELKSEDIVIALGAEPCGCYKAYKLFSSLAEHLRKRQRESFVSKKDE